MIRPPFRVHAIHLDTKRPFQWSVFLILVALYFLGNLAGIPLLRATNMPLEPLWFWGVATLVSAALIGISLFLAKRIGLGAPFIEGQLDREEIRDWFRSALALTVLLTIAGVPISLLMNLNADSAGYPAIWQLVLASLKAGIVEEVGYRFFLVTLLAWLGSLIKRDHEGRPPRAVFWVAIVLSGLIFGWAHVDARLSIPGVPVGALAMIMVLNTLLGILFGWMFWKLGLEWAVVAHFLYDAMISAVVIPVYLLNNPLVWLVLVGGLGIAAALAWRVLTCSRARVAAPET